ncbi:MAG: 5-methyltetrahydropteroyltriglutamate--homocysteine S-methyltransferase [Alphaproteobacteria bacterium]|nr:5-methyltetrahydropteroyltriglutamate--homocysteine S-methyltransferase [Alphaproteobacteria bacterium]
MTSHILSTNLGFPRIGSHRELKKALENYWSGASTAQELLNTAAALRARHWFVQQKAGIDHVPSNDFSFYDQVLDTIAMLGAVPERFGHKGGAVPLDVYFGMARGTPGAPAMEMTKWFDTNYHYIVPELTADTPFALSGSKALDEFNEAKFLGLHTRPVLIGPVTFLKIAKMRDGTDRWALLPRLLPVYLKLLAALAQAGAGWVQIDEPCLVGDLDDAAQAALRSAYAVLSQAPVKILLATYFGAVDDNLDTLAGLQVAGVHVDLVRAPEQLDAVCRAIPGGRTLSLGVVNGRNIWKTALTDAERLIERARELRGGALMVGPSCSLLHVPVDLDTEIAMDTELKSWLAFATQKLDEVAALTKAANGMRDSRYFNANAQALGSRATSARIHDPVVKARLEAVTPDMAERAAPFKARIALQQSLLKLPLLPTTSIGSLPQTQEIRELRAAFKKGAVDQASYDRQIEEKTAEAMRWQDEIGIDVPVHGEYERNDMVEYFGEQLRGFAFTERAWVQSYGSRCVKPPLIFGDVSRPKPMTLYWTGIAQRYTKKPVKGMLTGPVTILQWSFVRDDQPRSETCRQIALAIRDEVLDLEKAGVAIIQIDEAALREGLPIRKAQWRHYLDWAVEAFRLTAGGVAPATQIHTHMCYSEFNDIIAAVAAMDADVISIETSRSAMELLDAFVGFAYPNDIGPGVYDIHSPRVPSQAEMEDLLEKALKVLSPQQLWVNPDCGLKTRGWAEVKPALIAMVAAAKAVRGRLAAQQAERSIPA